MADASQRSIVLELVDLGVAQEVLANCGIQAARNDSRPFVRKARHTLLTGTLPGETAVGEDASSLPATTQLLIITAARLLAAAAASRLKVRWVGTAPALYEDTVNFRQR